MPKPSDLAELLAAASPGPWFLDEFYLLDAGTWQIAIMCKDGNPSTKSDAKATARLAALAPALAQELIKLREVLREVMEDHAWKDELWRFTDETEAVLAALAPTAEHETGEVGDGLL